MNEPPPDDAFDGFAAFVARVEPRLRVALAATFGSVDGRVALADALSWAWENWDRVPSIANPVAYLYRVGVSSAKRTRARPFPVRPSTDPLLSDEVVPDPDVVAAVNRLPGQQRRIVMLVHAFGWSQRDVAELLDLNASTVKQHLDRGVRRLVTELESRHAD